MVTDHFTTTFVSESCGKALADIREKYEELLIPYYLNLRLADYLIFILSITFRSNLFD